MVNQHQLIALVILGTKISPPGPRGTPETLRLSWRYHTLGEVRKSVALEIRVNTEHEEPEPLHGARTHEGLKKLVEKLQIRRALLEQFVHAVREDKSEISIMLPEPVSGKRPASSAFEWP